MRMKYNDHDHDQSSAELQHEHYAQQSVKLICRNWNVSHLNVIISDYYYRST